MPCHRYKPNLAGILLLGAVLAAPGAVNAQEPVDETGPPRPAIAPRQQVITVSITGQIGKKHIDEFRAAVAKVTGDPLPAGLILLVNSPGGDGLAAMELGRLARAHKAHIFVRERCASACVFLLAGGVYRDAAPDAIGIHRGRLTRFVQGKGTVNADIGSDERLRDLLALAEKQAREHFAQMGMPEQLFESMQRVPPSHMRLLNREEAAELGLIGFDKTYLEERSAAFAARYNISREQLERRSAQTTSQCEEQIRTQVNFTACYRRSLLADRAAPAPESASQAPQGASQTPPPGVQPASN